jgi:Leucine-rich repeat (LRR) protein
MFFSNQIKRLEAVEANTFTGLDTLETLNLNKNNITEINGPFPVSLVQLLLEENRLNQINRRFFSANATSLRILMLNGNEIGTIEENAFADLTALTELSLEHNQLTSLRGNMFFSPYQENIDFNSTTNTTDNENYDADKNQVDEGNKSADSSDLTMIGPKSSLRKVSFAYNKITGIDDPLTFQHMVKLEELYLNHNQIESLDVESFRGLFSLRTLSLVENKLDKLPSGLFADLEDLQSLWLESNHLKALDDPHIFEGNFYWIKPR